MKAGIITPLYLSGSWILTISYQLLTHTAVTTIASNIAFLWPSASIWLYANIETIAFVYAFTWIFVLSSVIPSAIIGKERSFVAQYVVVLVLSLLAFFMPDILSTTAGIDINQALTSVALFQNIAIAIVYLSAPYLFMIGIDWRAKRMAKKIKKEELITKYNNEKRNRLSKLLGDKDLESS